MSKANETHKPMGLRKAGDAEINPVTPISPQNDDVSRLSRRGNSGDAVGMPDKDKQVDLGVQVPKSLRKALRREADRAGVTVDEYVAEILRRR